MADEATTAVRGRVLTFTADPALAGADASHRYIGDALVVMRGGLIEAVGEAAALLRTLPPGTQVDHYPDGLIMPGFVDAHIHYSQTRVIGSHGAQLLEWLQRYTFPEEERLREADAAAAAAGFFLDELLRCGTTTAAVYCTVHPESVEAFFAESERRGTRMIAGKVMMDRNAPPGVLDTAEREPRGERGAAAPLARARAAALRRDAALRAHLDGRPARSGRSAGPRLPDRVRADAPRREPCRDCGDQGAVPLGAELYGRV